MDIKRAVDSADEKICREVLHAVLMQYMSPAFSALPSREIDLVIIDALEKLQYISEEPTLYELVQKLRVTRSKARSLLYDRELRRIDANELDKKVLEVIKAPIVQKQGEQFVFEIENPLVSDHLRAKIQRLGHASDGSFSPSLVKLTITAFSALIAEEVPEADREKVREALIKAGAPDSSFAGVIKGALKQIGKKVAEDAGQDAAEVLGEYVSSILSGLAGGVSELSSKLPWLKDRDDDS